MDERPQSATVDLKVRMKEPLRVSLETAAKARGVSMNAEAVARLERSFSEESAFGGPDLRDAVFSMVAAFAYNGERAAQAEGHPEWTARDWLADPDCYREAMLAAMESLLMKQPGAGFEKIQLQIETLKARMMTRFVRVHEAAAGEEGKDR
jgi:hypothetical protein